MKLSRQQFEHLFQENRLVLSFIGMSNIGKTFWSNKLKDVGFRHINCDDLIEARLSIILEELGYSGVEDVSKWMGQPYDERFPVNQRTYLSFEKETMEKIFTQIKKEKIQNTIIDTTGSIVHTGSDICTKLNRYSLVIYIEATETMKKKMFHQYINEPKPVVFGNMFYTKRHETTMQALERCYKKLLDERSALYAEYADVIFPRETIDKNVNADQFISLLKQSL